MSGQTFVLDNDIYLNDVLKYENWKSIAPTNRWTTIGTSKTHCFSGVFDGSDFSIEGLYISGDSYQYRGLFGYTAESSEICNVNMTYEYISNSYSYDCYAGGITAYSNGKISNCSTDTMSIIISSTNTPSTKETKYIYAGGITAYSNGKISNCANNGTISSSSYSSPSYGGGIAGESLAEISDCINNGTISSSSSLSSSSASSYGGGIAGCSLKLINNCINNGTISSYSPFSDGGGIAGYSTAAISNCSNNGNVSSNSTSTSFSTSFSTASSDAGGIAGCSTAGIISCSNNGNISSSFYHPHYYLYPYSGGIVGESYYYAKEIIISNVYNTGEVTAEDYEGGIVGNSSTSSHKLTISNAFNIGNVSAAILGRGGLKYVTIINTSYLIGQSEQGRTGYTDDDEIVAKSKEEMQTKEFAESLGDAFVYVEGDYPKLAWEVNGNIEEPTEITSETTSEDTSNMENTTDISETESISDRPKDIWNGTTDTSWYNSEEIEFHISTPEELAGLAELVNGGKSMSGKTFILDNDIYLNDVSDFENWSDTAPENRWTPIGISDTYYFSGIFDGAGFSIEGLYISGDSYRYSGILGYTTESSEIKNFNTAYEYINYTYSDNMCYVGGIIAYSNGKISNCTNNGPVAFSTDSYSYGGGIVGYSNTEISNCTNNGNITFSADSNSYGGGIAGYSAAEISSCTNNGNITSSSEFFSFKGGIVGYSTAEIISCTNSGIITSSSSSSPSYGGGIVGKSSANISNCTNSGTVTSSSSSSSSFSSYGGGIVGNSSAEIGNCTNSGDVTSSSFYDDHSSNSCGGGIAGYSSANISNCKNNGTVNATATHSKSYSYGGGIAGLFSSYAKEIIISNVYNTGSVTAGSYEGGIVGGFNYTSPHKLTINNTYNIGKVSYAILGTSIYRDIFKIINTSYLIEQSEQGCKDYTDDEKIVAKSKKEMQTKDFAESLGDAFVYVEGDYPKLAWEVNGNIEEPTEITSATTSEDTSNMENTTDISETESISTDITDITESPSESETTTTSTTKATTTVTSSYVTTTSTTTTLPVTTMETSTMTTENTTSTEVTKLSTTITTTATEPLKAGIDSTEIEVGEKTTIKTNQENLIFKTSNSDVAIVSRTGVITPVSAGTAIITIINADGDSVQIKIEVKDSSLETTSATVLTTTETTKITTILTEDSTIPATTSTIKSTTPTTKSTTEKTTSVTTTITKPTTTVTTKPTVKISVGDVNDDGSIDSKDAVLVLKYYAESLTGSTTTKITLEKGDVNSDGKIDSKDAVKILKYYAQTMVGLKVDIKDV